MSLDAAINKLRGVWNIVPTPFEPSGDLDLASLRSLTDFVVDTGVDGMTVLGVLGEGAKVSDSERDLVIETVIAHAAGRLPVCVAVTAPSTHRACEYARKAAATGAHSLMLAPPPLARPNDEAVRRHFLTVADTVDIPIVVQDHPPSSGVWMSVGLLSRMAEEHPGLRVIKLEEEPTPPKVSTLLTANPQLRVLGGLGAEMFFEELRRGAVGTMTGFGYPEILVDIWRRFGIGDLNGAQSRFYHVMPLVRFENQALLNLPLRKHVYWRRGAIASAHVRSPAPPLDDETKRDLVELVERLGLR